MKLPTVLLMMVIFLGFAVAGCGAAHDSDVAGPVALVPWDGQYQALFGDAIDAVAVGLSLDGRKAEEAPLLRARVLTAEHIVRLRVQTLTADTVGAKTSYVLGLRALEAPLFAAKSSTLPQEIAVTRDHPAFGIVNSMTSTLRGQRFIGFFRRFRNSDGTKVHWHLTADTKEVADRVKNVVALETVAKQ